MKINHKTNISFFIKRLLRKATSAHSNCPVVIISGNSPPRLIGESYHYVNKSGDRIHYPNAYRRAWGKPIYINSTLRVEVGADYLLNNLSIAEIQLQSLKTFQ